MKTHITLKNGIMLFCIFFFGFNIVFAQESIKKQKQATTWNGASWSNGLPNAQTKAIFAADFTSDQTLTAESIEVAANAKVTFASGTNLIVTNEVNVSPQGNLTFNVNANLSQKNPNIVNTTLATFTRTTPSITKFDYVYWSSPVQGQNIGAFSPDTLSDKYLQYTPPPGAGWQSVPPATTTMEVGKGYAIRGPQPFIALTPFDGVFTGMPNNTDVTTPIGVGSNLIGNPYPDGLSADCFILDPNNQAATGGCLFFWTHNIPIDFTGLTPGTAVYNYNVNSYASYNLLGGVGTGVTVNANNQVSVDRPKGYVASGQGFFINGVANGSASFKNSMRSSNLADNDQFFRANNPNSVASVQCPTTRHRIWVRLTNGNNFKETLVGYAPSATTSATLDRNYDAKVFSVSTVIDLYSLSPVSQEKLTIQGRALGASFNTDDVIPLGFTCPAGNNTISATDFDGLFGSQMFWLKETVGMTITYRDIRTAGYTFTTAVATTDTTRFQIVFKNNLNTTQLQNGFCNITITNLNNSLFCNPIAGATAYIFEVTEVRNPSNVRTITRTASSFSMQMLPGITTLGTTYSVRVSPIIGVLSQGFGPACTITTPALPPTTSLSSGCGSSNAIWVSFFINQVQPIGGVAPTRYRVQVVNVNAGVTSFLDLNYPSSSFQLQNTNFAPAVTVSPNAVYNISVTYEWNGVWQNYGAVCTHTKGPVLTKQLQSGSSVFEARAYPNPFDSNFNIELQTNSDENVSIKAYDMLGRLVETHDTTISDFYSQKIGTTFSSGVYTIVITQGDNIRTVRVIKR